MPELKLNHISKGGIDVFSVFVLEKDLRVVMMPNWFASWALEVIFMTTSVPLVTTKPPSWYRFMSTNSGASDDKVSITTTLYYGKLQWRQGRQSWYHNNVLGPVSISRKFPKPLDLYLKMSDRFEIWRTSRQQCCRSACQILKAMLWIKLPISWLLETSRDLIGYWNGTLVPVSVVCVSVHTFVFQ